MDKPALIVGDEVRTYGELADRSNRLAHACIGLGLPTDATGAVAAMLPNGFEFFEVAMAACRAEARFLPVNWHLKADELAYILGDSGAQVLVAHESLREHVDAAIAQAPATRVLIVGDEFEQAIAAADDAPERVGWRAPAFIFYTSGTTGRPKGVVHGGLTPDRMELAHQGLMALWGFTADDVHLLGGPSYHAGPGGYAFTTLYAGGTVAILPAWDAEDALRTIEKHRCTTTFLTPAHFIRLLELPEDVRARYDTTSLRLVIHGGAPCPVNVKERIIAALPHTEVWELYGASEGGATRVSPEEWLVRPGTVGKPWPNVEIRIVDADGAPLPVGGEGVIHIKPAAGSTFHYHRDEAKTAAAWHDGAFTVGDVGRLDDDGYLYITDRIADMVLRDGVNVYPREIEDVLFTHPAVVDCAVFGVPDERHGEVLVAVVEARHAVDDAGLASHVRAHLADFKCPAHWQLVDTLPRDPNGKILKRLLRAAHVP
ncbi:MAG: long-chain acyl-CoA synthetase [Acidimicrobiaceae bacterium]